MPRSYKPDPRGKRYTKHTPQAISEALADHRRGMSFRSCSKKYGIPIAVLCRRAKTPNMKTQGGQTALDRELEIYMARRIATCASWGFPLDNLEIRFLVKGYLDRRGVSIRRFRENLPIKDWVDSFVKRNREIVAHRICQNIKPSRASLSPAVIEVYFSNLQKSITDIPPANIMNYDETNLTYDPGRKKIITKRGTKHPERIIDHNKSSISIMYAGCANGNLLPPYVCYKATNMYESWKTGGPPGTRYNRSSSGWFEMQTFEDWFETVALPYLKNLEGKKIMIGDNLSSHLSAEVIKQCEENYIAFVFLPPGSTHILQPLDVSFFRPLKQAWRNVLEEEKSKLKGSFSLSKDAFPSLLNKLHINVYNNAAANLKSGFEKCGIYPLNKERALSSIPRRNTCTNDAQRKDQESFSVMDDSLLTLRYGENAPPQTQKRKRLNVEPGKSVGAADLLSTSCQGMALTSTSCTESGEVNDFGQEDIVTLYATGDYVTFTYEGEVFPGQIVDVQHEGCVIKSMVKSGFHWKWPKDEDVLLYPFDDVKSKIAPPQIRKRGVFCVPELDSVWGI